MLKTGHLGVSVWIVLCVIRELFGARVVIHVCLFAVVLGNAYVSMFFACGQKPEFSQQALSAYAQAVSTKR